MPSIEQRRDHKEKVNCAPLSEVMTSGMPNRTIREVMKASAQSTADMLRIGMASSHLVDLSMRVKR
jgi:hypothetical protein